MTEYVSFVSLLPRLATAAVASRPLALSAYALAATMLPVAATGRCTRGNGGWL